MRVIFSILTLGVAMSSALFADPDFKQQPPGQQSVPSQNATTDQQGQGSSVTANQPGVTSIQWYTNYSQALAAAKKNNKPLVLFFTGSDWCGWCKKIDTEVFMDPEFVRMVGDRFIFVDLDFPMNKLLPLDISEQNSQLKHKYGITGYPTVVVINPDETFIAETGYRPGGGKAYADYLLSLIQK